MRRSGLFSLTLHIAALVLLICAATSPQAERTFNQVIAPYVPLARDNGSLLPPKRGKLPRAAPREPRRRGIRRCGYLETLR
ncbi:MAG: hypothetical protein ACE15B_03795 [Bryobacteraceae bacterium]